MRALVTGGAGFIGHHLVRGLLARGDEVSVLDAFITGSRDRLTEIEDRIDLIEGDIREPADLDRAMAGCEVVFHLAAIPSVQRSMLEPRMTHDVNVTGTVEVALAAGRAGVRRIIFAGSSAVYGNAPILPRREDQLPDPQSPYATGKLAGEHYLRVLGPALGFESVVLRYFNIFGAGQDPNSDYAAVVPRFVTAALRGDRPIVYGDGLQSRDFTHVDNVVSANLLASVAPGADGAVCNIGCGGRYSLLELLAAIGDALGQPLDPVFEPVRLGDVPHSQAAIDAASERLGYRVLVPFAEGIARTVAWYREHSAARPVG
jgi:UDP-N-acetylglucosamine/UDP-N-acetyl-alpha-D-glucosaminouronate 4-epimerase